MNNDWCTLILPRPGEDYWDYFERARIELGVMAPACAVGVQNTWIYHPDSPHNKPPVLQSL